MKNEFELWGNNRFCWVVGNSNMPQINKFKNTREGLVIFRWGKGLIKNILMYFLMKNLPLNNVLTMLLAVIKKSLGILYSKIFTHYLQRIFDSSNRLQMSFMTNLITVLSMKNKSQDSSNLSNNTCHRRYLSWIIFPQELGLELIKFQR